MWILDALEQETEETPVNSGCYPCYPLGEQRGNTETRANSGCYPVTPVTPVEEKSKSDFSENFLTEKRETPPVFDKTYFEKENMKCCQCKKWQKKGFFSGVCQLTNIETSVIAHCRQIERWP